MTKFAAQSSSVFRSKEACEGRVIRKAKVVVIVEADDGSWCELDADGLLHGEVLATNWVDVLGAKGACVWPVSKNGVLFPNPSFRRFPEVAYWEE